MQSYRQAYDLLSQLKGELRSLLNFKPLAAVDLVGLDINVDSIKLLKLNHHSTPPKVENFAVARLPENIIVKDEIKDFPALSRAIKALFTEAGVTTNQVALAIPQSIAITKTVNIDKRLTDIEIETRVWIEANKYFPDLVGEIYLDFFINGLSLQDASQLEVTLVACRKEQIKAYLEVMRLAQLHAINIDVDSYALERSLTFLMPETTATMGLLNLNMNLSNLIVVKEGRIIYAHNQNFDGQRLKSKLNTYLKDMAVNEIDENKLLADPAYQEILNVGLLAHLRHVTQLFYTSRPNIHMQTLILCGDCATLPALASFIQKETGIEIKVADLASHLTLDSSINIALFKAHASTLMLALGLALTEER